MTDPKESKFSFTTSFHFQSGRAFFDGFTMETRISDEMGAKYRSNMEVMENDFGCLSFGHLTEYASCYYGYLWSRIFAQDVFSHIEKGGLLNPKMGRRYVHHILRPGGNRDPNMMLNNFLGRDPSQDAFMKSIKSEEVDLQ